jgi:hypothetical protein
VLIRHESDDDFHAVLSNGRRTMISESPAPTCDSRAFPVRQAQMAAARRALRLCARAQVTGVAFVDFDYGQTGVAPNAIELHPIPRFRCLAGPASAGGGGADSAGSGRSSGSVGVHLVQVTSPASAGSDASVTDAVSWAQTCSITITYRSGPSQAAGLYPQRGTRIIWTLTVGSRTTPGRWAIVVSWARGGALQTSFVVTRCNSSPCLSSRER